MRVIINDNNLFEIKMLIIFKDENVLIFLKIEMRGEENIK